MLLEIRYYSRMNWKKCSLWSSGTRIVETWFHKRYGDRRRVEDRPDDLVVARAATQIAGQPVTDLGLCRMRVLFQQRLGGDDEAWGAASALRGGVPQELLLQRMQPVRTGDALDGRHAPVLNLSAEDEA